MENVHNLLKGRPVLVMRAGHWPNSNDIADVMSTFPNHIVRTEVVHEPATRFAVTVQRRKS